MERKSGSHLPMFTLFRVSHLSFPFSRTIMNNTMSPQDILSSHSSFHDSLFPSPSSSSPSIPSSQTPPHPTVLSPPSGGQPPSVIITPCAACKILRRRCCIGQCLLAPYFPPTEPLKFTIAHRVFGASNIIKFLQDLPESEREDAVSSMVYEANARIRDPVYGSAGAICHLQRQVCELQEQLAKAQAEILIMEQQHTSLVSLICMKTSQEQQPSNDNGSQYNQFNSNFNFLPEDVSFGSAWEPLWA